MAYLSDIEIAQQCQMKPITEIAAKAHVDDKYIEQYGKYKAKIDLALLDETDRKDGKLVLFHDNTLERVTGEAGSIKDYTYEELQKFDVKKGEFTDKILLLEDFLKEFADTDLFFAIELKVDGIEKEVVSLIYKYGVEKRTTVTAFELSRLVKVREFAPKIRVGYLTKSVGEVVAKLLFFGVEEICPHYSLCTTEKVNELHRLGFNVRAWGIAADPERMKIAYEAGTDGMTINAPDLLVKLIAENND